MKDSPKTKRKDNVKVIFHNQEGSGGSDDIFVSVNGVAYLIKREHEVELPGEVMEVFDNAEQTVFERSAGDASRPKDVKRFAYSVVG